MRTMPDLRCFFENKAAPPQEEGHPAEGRDGAEPMLIGQRQQVEGAGKNQDTRQKTPPGKPRERLAFGQHEQHDGVDKVVKDSLFPNLGGPVLDKQRF